MKNRILSAIKKIYLFIIFTFPLLVNAAGSGNRTIDTLKDIGSGEKGPYQDVDRFGLSIIIGTVIQMALSLLGVIFLVLMLYAGYHWMTAQGEEEKVEKAKDTITRAIIGLVIVIGSYAIWAFVFSKLF